MSDLLNPQYDHPDCDPRDTPCGWADLELEVSGADVAIEDEIDRMQEAHLETGD
jgi:hypothetical protein